MLRKAAKPEPPKRAEDVRLWLGVHDLSRIEWTAAVQIPGSAERKYDVQLAVDIPSTMFPSHSVWEHLQIFTRLQSPAEEGPLRIDDLLFEKTLQPEELRATNNDPFRGSAHPAQLVEWLVADGLAVMLAKGHVTQREAHTLWRFADALGASRDDFRRLTSSASRWFPQP